MHVRNYTFCLCGNAGEIVVKKKKMWICMPRIFCTSLFQHLQFLQCCYFIQAHIISSSLSRVFRSSCSLCFYHTLRPIHSVSCFALFCYTFAFACATELCACRAQSYLYREQVSIRYVKVLCTECQTSSKKHSQYERTRWWCVRFNIVSSINRCFGAQPIRWKFTKNWFIVVRSCTSLSLVSVTLV